ncbi:MAG: EAL domain-containing protein [Caulobacterales bacterium]|nr:EAL domain-containing protein [Caulobacterales bacterium]
MRLGITVKATACLALVFATVIAFVVSIIILSERRIADERFEELALVRMHAIRDAYLRDLAAGDGEAGESTHLMETMRFTQLMNYAFVTDAEGRIVAQNAGNFAFALRDYDAYTMRALASGALEKGMGQSNVHLALPITQDGAQVGVVRFGFGDWLISSRLASIARRSILAGIIGVCLILPLAAMAIHRSIRPMKDLTAAFAHVANRNFDHVLDVRSGDEMETLAKAFNAMVTQLRTSMRRVQQLAFRDDLTRLPNRNAFLLSAKKAAEAEGASGAIILINLDRFKRVNNTLGESEGDRILTAAARRLHSVIAQAARQHGGSAMLARLSGDAFALLLRAPAPTAAARAIASAALKAMSAPFVIAEQQITLTASIGIARFPLDGDESERVMRNANLALDAAKADGGGRFRFFEPEMTRRAVERVTLENELRRAVAEREFVVHYQPKVDTRDGVIVGAEALVRWNRKGRLVFPGKFIAAAEESGLISEIGDFVLQEALSAAVRWRDMGLRAEVAVNVSAIQFERDDFAQRIEAAMAATGIDPELLELELTESVAMTEPERVISQIRPLRAKGVRFAIDDFGTGYSSLASLTRLPFDVFKIDQSFVRRVDEDVNARVVIETILAMARALGCQTVAEGVESSTQYAFLRLSGCTLGQGWFFGKPMPEDEFVELLRSDRDRAADRLIPPEGDTDSYLRVVS